MHRNPHEQYGSLCTCYKRAEPSQQGRIALAFKLSAIYFFDVL
jgi:hypothetical protein